MASPDVTLLYEAGPCLVVAKPPGLLTQAPAGIDSLEDRVRAYLKQRDNKPGNIYLAVIHRLDRPVSGPLIFARHVRAARRLAEQFELRMVRKTYWACVAGEVDPPEGTWTDHIRKVPDVAQAEIVPADHPEGRQAVLHYRLMGRTRHGCWLEIELETGRMHQIRVQAAARGFPVLGDSQYGSRVEFGEQFADPRLRTIALHGRRLKFRHPMNREQVEVVAPLPPAWEELELPPQATF